MASSQSWTWSEALSWAVNQQGQEQRQAEEILASIIHKTRLELLTDMALNSSAHLSAEEQDLFCVKIKQRAQGMPLQYLVGHVSFLEIEVLVNPHVLIPRPETEELCEWVLENVSSEAKNVADVGSGSGVIALALAQARPKWRMIGLDRSPSALELAKQNARRLGLQEQVEWRVSHLLSAWPKQKPLDVVVANLPYIPSQDVLTLMPEVRDYEPHLALDGGGDGLRLVEELLDQAYEQLAINGDIFLEVGFDQGGRVVQMGQSRGYQTIVLKADLAGHFRFLHLKKERS